MGYLKKIVMLIALGATLSTVDASACNPRTKIVKKSTAESTIHHKRKVPGAKKRVSRKKWVEHGQINGSDKATARFPTKPTLLFASAFNQEATSQWEMSTTWAREKNVIYGFSTPQSPVSIEDPEQFLTEYRARTLTSNRKLIRAKSLKVNDMPAMDLIVYHKDTKLTSNIRVVITDQTFYEAFIVRKHRKGDRKRIHHNLFIASFKTEKVAPEQIQPEGQVVILPATEIESPAVEEQSAASEKEEASIEEAIAEAAAEELAPEAVVLQEPSNTTAVAQENQIEAASELTFDDL